MPECKSLISFLPFLFTAFPLFSADHKGIVTVSALKMRATAERNGKVVKTLPRATIVEILAESEKKIVVDNIEGGWLQVKSEGGDAGWVFSGFVSRDYQFVHGQKNKVAWSLTTLPQGHPTGREIVFYDTDSKKILKIPVDAESFDYSFSRDLKYVAVNGGTYVFGTLYIHNVEDGKLAHSSGFYPRVIRWQGNTLQFNTLLCDDLVTGGSVVVWEEVAFSEGKISRSGKFGYEGNNIAESESCRPYLKKVK